MSIESPIRPIAETAIRRWVRGNQLAAVKAAGLLGGVSAGTAIGKLLADLTLAQSITSTHWCRLRALQRLLTLDSPLSEENLLPLHPADPRVVDICRLADSLAQLLDQIERAGLRAA